MLLERWRMLGICREPGICFWPSTWSSLTFELVGISLCQWWCSLHCAIMNHVNPVLLPGMSWLWRIFWMCDMAGRVDITWPSNCKRGECQQTSWQHHSHNNNHNNVTHWLRCFLLLYLVYIPQDQARKQRCWYGCSAELSVFLFPRQLTSSQLSNIRSRLIQGKFRDLTIYCKAICRVSHTSEPSKMRTGKLNVYITTPSLPLPLPRTFPIFHQTTSTKVNLHHHILSLTVLHINTR